MLPIYYSRIHFCQIRIDPHESALEDIQTKGYIVLNNPDIKTDEYIRHVFVILIKRRF